MTEKIMKKITGTFFILMTAWIIAAEYGLCVHAENGGEEIQFSQFMKALQPIDAKAEPDENAVTIFHYDAGDTVYVTGETENGWFIVFYQGQTGYIKNNALQGAESTQDVEDDRNVQVDQSAQDTQNGQIVLELEGIDIDALDKELTAMEIKNKLIIEEVERYRAEAFRSKIWATIIVSLVIGIFVVGIVSTVGSEKWDNEDDSNKSDKDDNADVEKVAGVDNDNDFDFDIDDDADFDIE